jgi:hypothetical protein
LRCCVLLVRIKRIPKAGFARTRQKSTAERDLVHVGRNLDAGRSQDDDE